MRLATAESRYGLAPPGIGDSSDILGDAQSGVWSGSIVNYEVNTYGDADTDILCTRVSAVLTADFEALDEA